MAAICILETKINPSKELLTSPVWPFDKLAKNIFPSSIMFAKSNPEWLWPIMFLIISFSINRPTLLTTYPNISLLVFPVVCAHSLTQKFFTTGSQSFPAPQNLFALACYIQAYSTPGDAPNQTVQTK